MATIRITSSMGVYDVQCANGALGRARSMIANVGDATGVYLVSSPRVWRQWGKRVASALGISRADRVVLFDDAEKAKRLETVEGIARALVKAGADRRSIVVAVGGGVVGDVGGFAAASYLRGVRLAHIPTTVVAQVDSSIGGKTGVDLPEGKNLVGAFYPPKVVVADPTLLATLPHREFRSGLYEVVKYGVIADGELFDFFEKKLPAILRRDHSAMGWLILRSIRIKAYVVEKDEHESGLRKILNFGHTLGHALETATNYSRFKHGEAVGWGMIAATMMAMAIGLLEESEATRIIRVVAAIGPLPPLKGISLAKLRPILLGDKKSQGGKVLWVLPTRIGKTEWNCEVPWQVVSSVFAELPGIVAKAT
ncbi:MAG TPA: 3-dehydroquinate synthase [Candidatus Acidoferrum sp.]|jgi:3-dehydroquinate synthase|nr:3-dehydroquinate synthase [Candidatus Acidoferrum sp.]